MCLVIDLVRMKRKGYEDDASSRYANGVYIYSKSSALENLAKEKLKKNLSYTVTYLLQYWMFIVYMKMLYIWLVSRSVKTPKRRKNAKKKKDTVDVSKAYIYIRQNIVIQAKTILSI